jgi:DNA-binding beta-propeller fold protein YncE
VPGSLLKIDAHTSSKVGEVLVDRSPGDVILSKDGKLAFVTHYDLLRLQAQLASGAAPEKGFSGLAIVDTEKMTRLSLTSLCPTAHGEGLSADEKTLYVTCTLSDELAVVDVSNPAKPTLKMKLPVGPAPGPTGTPSYSPYALMVDPADGTVWISDNSSADVRVFDPATMKMDESKTVFTGGVSMFAAFTHDGKNFYVPHQGDDRVTWVDTGTFTQQELSLPQSVCLNVHAIVLTPDDQSAVAVCEGDHLNRPGTVVTINLQGFFVVGAVSVGLFPDGAAWLPPVQ